jgi:hypothetical protein
MVIALALVSDAQISVPHTFTTSVPVSQLNTNLSTIADGALKRNGGNITDDITVDTGVTIDGVDISAALGGSSTGAFAALTTSNLGATSIDAAGGITAGTGNVAIIGTDGRIPAINGTYFASLSGANITGIPSQAAITTTWATPTYAAGDFTTNGAGGWTVESGDVFINRYVEIGKTMHWSVVVTTTTVTAATGTELRFRIPNSRTAAGGVSGNAIGLNNSVAFNGMYQVIGGNTYVSVYTDAAAATAWTASSNTTQVRFNLTLEVA